jgi:hypothetical protein
MAKIIGYIGAAVVGAAVAGSSSYWKYLNPPSTQQRWSNKTQVTPNATPAFTELQSKDLLGQRWKKPTISVYSAPYHAPQPVHFTLKDLSKGLIPLSQVPPHLAFEEKRTRGSAGAGVLRAA